MPRTKSFEPTAAAGQAMELFWRSGIKRTTFDRLVARTGASRYGLYATFGGKDGLLVAALDRYRQDVVAQLFAPLEDPHAGLPELRQWLQGMLAFHERTGPRGCLNCNTAVDIGQTRTAAARRVRAHFTRLQDLLRRALQNARDAGGLRPDRDPADAAAYFTAVAAGSFLLARASMPPEIARALILGALAEAGVPP